MLPFFMFFFVFVSDAAGIEFDRGALEHGSALDDATVAVEDRCSTVVNSLAKAKEVLGRFYQELFPKGASLEDVDALAEALSAEEPAAYKRKQKGILRRTSASRRASARPSGWRWPWRLGRSWTCPRSLLGCRRLRMDQR